MGSKSGWTVKVKQSIIDFLKPNYMGIKKIFLTHPDADHTNLIPLFLSHSLINGKNVIG